MEPSETNDSNQVSHTPVTESNTTQTGEAAAGGEDKKKWKPFKSVFPPGAIKRIMQSDPETPNVAKAALVGASAALEAFLKDVGEQTAAVAQERGTKRVRAAHLKEAFNRHDRFDILRDVVASAPNLPTKEEEEEQKREKQRARAKRKKDKEEEEKKEEGAPKKKKVKVEEEEWGASEEELKTKLKEGQKEEKKEKEKEKEIVQEKEKKVKKESEAEVIAGEGQVGEDAKRSDTLDTEAAIAAAKSVLASRQAKEEDDEDYDEYD